MVLSHNDLLANNILIAPSGKIFLIDFEYANYNLAAFDLMNYLTESTFSYIDRDPWFEANPNFPHASKQMLYEHYAYFCCREVSEEEADRVAEGAGFALGEAEGRLIEGLRGQEQACLMLCNLNWAMWAIWMAGESASEMNYLEFAGARVRMYREVRMR